MASLAVTTQAAGSIGPAFAGLSYEKMAVQWSFFQPSNVVGITLFQALGPSLLRIGGSSVDQFVWTPNGAGRTYLQVAASDVDALAAFVKAAGWQILYGVNLGGAATGATTPALAAEEVAYAVEQFGSCLYGIEIGNEPDAYGAAGKYYAGNWSLAQYLTLWGQFRAAILATTPGVPITGSAASYNVSTWTIPYAQAVAPSGEITLLTQHYYRASGQAPTSTAAFLVTPDANLVAEVAILKAGSKSTAVPYRIAECNSFYAGGASGVSNSYASSLWVIDFLFNCAQGGALGVNLHGGGNGPGYTPIADWNGIIQGVRPEYYGILVLHAGRPGHAICDPTLGWISQRHRLCGASTFRQPQPCHCEQGSDSESPARGTTSTTRSVGGVAGDDPIVSRSRDARTCGHRRRHDSRIAGEPG